MDADVTYSIIKKIGDAPMRIKCTWLKSEFEIVLLTNEKVFHAKVTEEYIKSYAKQLKILLPEYIQNIRNYISNGPECVDMLVLENTFTIYSNKNKMKIKYFYISLEELNYRLSVEDLFDEVVTKNKELLCSLDISRIQYEEIKKEIEGCKDVLRKMNITKKDEEQRLLSGFTLLLNEKKKKIQFLNQIIESKRLCSGDRLDINSMTKETISESDPNELYSIKNSSSGSEDSKNEYITDNENEDKYIPGLSNTQEFLRKNSPPPTLQPRQAREEEYEICKKRQKFNDRASVNNSQNNIICDATHIVSSLVSTVTATQENLLVPETQRSQSLNFSMEDILDKV